MSYIRNQIEHHAKMSFQDEYRRICEKHNIEIDERCTFADRTEAIDERIGPRVLNSSCPSPSGLATNG